MCLCVCVFVTHDEKAVPLSDSRRQGFSQQLLLVVRGARRDLCTCEFVCARKREQYTHISAQGAPCPPIHPPIHTVTHRQTHRHTHTQTQTHRHTQLLHLDKLDLVGSLELVLVNPLRKVAERLGGSMRIPAVGL